MKHFFPISPDRFLKKRKGDGALARFGHLNVLVDKFNEFDAHQAITASIIQTQAAGTPLILGFNLVTTAVTGDTVVLPSLVAYCACTGGCGPIGPVIVKNEGPGSLTIYPFPGEDIDGGATDVPITLDPGSSVSFTDMDCNSWESYSNSTDPAFTGVNSVTGTTVDNTDPANPVVNAQEPLQFEDEGVNLGTAGTVTELDFVGAGVTATRVLDKVTVTIPGAAAATLGYAEYVQHTQGSNASIAPGSAIEYLTDNPAGVFNTLGITTTTGPGGQGTEFLLPIGVYMIDYENSADAAWSLAIYKSLVTQTEVIDVETISGASTATTWIHGRAIISAAAPTYIIISPVVGTQAIPTAGTAAGQFIARITFLKIA